MDTNRDSASRGVYLYCFGRPDAVTTDGALDQLTLGDVAVVFSRVDLDEWQGAAIQAKFEDTQWLIPRVLAHEEVIESQLAAGPVLPVRFGAVFSSSAVLADFVAARQTEISDFLDRMVGREEWAVKGFLAVKVAAEWLKANDRELAAQWDQLPAQQGARYFREKRLQADLERRAQQWGTRLAAALSDEFAPRAVETRTLRPQAAEGNKQKMVFHAAFLLDQPTVAGFRLGVEKFQNRYVDQGLRLEITGPWPPYNFCPPLAESS